MATSKERFHNVTVKHTGHCEVQEGTVVTVDGEVYPVRYWRHVISPDDELSNVPDRARSPFVDAIAHGAVSETKRTENAQFSAALAEAERAEREAAQEAAAATRAEATEAATETQP